MKSKEKIIRRSVRSLYRGEMKIYWKKYWQIINKYSKKQNKEILSSEIRQNI